jgi:hypothetical protein
MFITREGESNGKVSDLAMHLWTAAAQLPPWLESGGFATAVQMSGID